MFLLFRQETGIIAEELKITHNGTVYSNSTPSKLSALKFTNGDMMKVERNILATETPRGINFLHEIPGNIKAEELVNVVISNRRLLEQFRNADPDMYTAMAKLQESDDTTSVSAEVRAECTGAVRLLMMTR